MASKIFNSSPRSRTSKKQKNIVVTYIELCNNSNCLINTDTFSPFKTTLFWQWSPKIYAQLINLKKNSSSHTIITANFNDILHIEFQNFNLIYTDASKTSVRVGFAYSTSHTSILFKLHPEASIFTVETQAIKGALIFRKSIFQIKF